MLLHKKVWNDNPFEDWSASEEEDMRRGVCFGKGGGSSSTPQPTQSTVNQSNLPDYAEPYFKGLLDRTETASLTPYESYEGSRIAEFDPNTVAGFDAINAQAQAGTPAAFTNAEAALTNVAGSAPLAEQAQYGDMSSFTDSGIASQYMNPYISNVLDTQKARLNQNFNEQQLGRDAAAVQAGAFGNSRRGVQDAIAERELNMQMNELDAQGLAAAYQQGSALFGQEQQMDMANRQLNKAVFDANQQRALDQYGQQI